MATVQMMILLLVLPVCANQDISEQNVPIVNIQKKSIRFLLNLLFTFKQIDIFNTLCNIFVEDVCYPNQCQNDGLCVVDANGEPTCECQDGYYGEFCQFGKIIYQIKICRILFCVL